VGESRSEREAVCLRQVFGLVETPWGVLSGSTVAAVRSAFLSECVDGSAHEQGEEVAAMLKAIHAQEDRAATRQKAEQVAVKLKEMKLADAAAIVAAGIEETLYYYAFPTEHWRCLRTNITVVARSATENAGGGCVSRWEVCVDAGGGKIAACSRHELRHAAVSGHEPPFGSERSGMNAHEKTFGSPSGEPSTNRSMLQQMCEKVWTPPDK
jgi:Transposase, Mutator family